MTVTAPDSSSRLELGQLSLASSVIALTEFAGFGWSTRWVRCCTGYLFLAGFVSSQACTRLECCRGIAGLFAAVLRGCVSPRESLATPFGAFGERILSRATTVAFRAPVDVTERSFSIQNLVQIL